jgi:hypothetical protein
MTPIKRFQLTHQLLKDLGIKIIWTRQRAITIAAYLDETNEIVLNRDLWKRPPAWKKASGFIAPNLDMASFALCHELAHAVRNHFGISTPGPRIPIEEEQWCDLFALELCGLMGMSNHRRYAGYLDIKPRGKNAKSTYRSRQSVRRRSSYVAGNGLQASSADKRLRLSAAPKRMS